MRLMDERAKADAPKMIPEGERAAAKIDLEKLLPRPAVKRDGPLSPAMVKDGDVWRLVPPACVFPAWRADGAASHVKTLLPKHPIAKNLPEKWDIPHTEMYDEPFHVPKPDEVVFEETWDKGERFRSGCLWKVGKGTVFYFRPGHETFPVYRQAEPLRVIENAVRWMAQE
jgi:trehalose utilization protein